MSTLIAYTLLVMLILVSFVIVIGIFYGVFYILWKTKKKEPSNAVVISNHSIVPALMMDAIKTQDTIVGIISKHRVNKEKRDIDEYFDQKLRKWLVEHRLEVKRIID